MLGAFALFVAVGFTWGLPGSNTWAVDSISPRACGLGAIAETYWWGHFHTYPPLHTALLTLLSTPWLALAAARVGLHRAALEQELIQPLFMTAIELTARVVALGMALGVVLVTMRWWARLGGRVAGIAAGVVVATDAIFVYYAHTGNLEIPYLFWATWALVEMDRVMDGEPRERQALLLSAAAVLSKDQAAAALIGPLVVAMGGALLVAPRLTKDRRSLGRLGSAVAVSGALYLLVSGAIVNPVGFRRRIAFLLGPASQSWALYPRGLDGALHLARDAFDHVPRFTSWPLAAASVVGLFLACTGGRGVSRARMLLPFVAALSFTALFTFGARRSEDRFLLPQAVFFLPYASLVVARLAQAWPRARAAVYAAAAVATVPALVGVASMDGTLLADSRYEAERFLAGLPAQTHVEVLGTSIFLPRLPDDLDVVRPGTDPIAERQGLPGVTDIVDAAMDPRPRAPEYIVLATVLSLELVTHPPPPPPLRPFGSTAYHDDASHRLFRGLFDGSLGYERTLVATCKLPWPLECRDVHAATARDVWIYKRVP